MRAARRLPPDPDLVKPHRYLTLRPFPPNVRDPAVPVAPTTHHRRPRLGDRSGPEGLPPWVADLPRDRPTVSAGLGTVFTKPAICHAVIVGLCDEALTLLVTVGRDQDPADYGPQPEHVHIERYIPLSLLRRHCDLVVTDGGSDSLTAVLAHGRPVVVVPIQADQPANTARSTALDSGRAIALTDLSPETARHAVLAVPVNPAYRSATGRLRAEIDALPGLDHAVALLERLAVEGQPLVQAPDTSWQASLVGQRCDPRMTPSCWPGIRGKRVIRCCRPVDWL